MTKEEKIKEAWGELWNSFNESAKKCALNKDGYVASILQNGLNKDFTEFNASLVAWRPKSLEGIKNNNGWIKIESEDDLPKDDGEYWTDCINESYDCIQIANFDSRDRSFRFDSGQQIIPTHYQPIVKPKPPLY